MHSRPALTVCFVALALCGASHAGPTMSFPEVSLGARPSRSFAGDLCESAETLLSVPAGQEFIVTMVTSTVEGALTYGGTWTSGTFLMQDGTIILAGKSVGPHSGVPIGHGRGRLRVEEGTTLSIRKTGGASGCGHFYLQGYFVKAGSPYRTFLGTSDVRDVFTADSGQDFIVRTVALFSREGPSHCHVYLDDRLYIHGSSWTTLDWGTYSGGFGGGGFAQGHGMLVVPAGSTLQIGPEDASHSVQCDYYIEGQYIEP